ncbi:MAG: hypothetical protein PHR06_03345 [Candidatus Cloacimonetes bacterium]|nr:hypothetical protein [Candidatus Cloacimonadota bacterium]
MKKIVILGVTGSIGQSALKIISQHSDRFSICLASTHSRVSELREYAESFSSLRWQ